MKQITGHTRLTGLLGSPVSHSKSPQMHNEGFLQLNLDYAYLAFDVSPETLGTAIQGLVSMNARGFNLTMPHKTAACEFCHKLSPTAEIIGAINTVVNDDGILTGHATDGIGFMRAVKEAGVDVIGKTMTVLGTGGAATAIFVQAALDGVSEIFLFNRHGKSFERAASIIEKLKSYSNTKIHLYDYEDETILRNAIQSSVLLVNGTSIGMAPNTEASIIENSTMFHPELFVSDIIYNPSETRFLRLAKEAGCKTQNGLNMLLYQGAEAFKLWTGEEMPVELIKDKYFK